MMRLCHGHDESLTIPGADKSEEEQRFVINCQRDFNPTSRRTFNLFFFNQNKYFIGFIHLRKWLIKYNLQSCNAMGCFAAGGTEALYNLSTGR